MMMARFRGRRNNTKQAVDQTLTVHSDLIGTAYLINLIRKKTAGLYKSPRAQMGSLRT